ncbi:MAG: hypothetical protein GXO14_05230 [Thermococci archaeon]|nr:hypothetical protein [Thermococci archaeon]
MGKGIAVGMTILVLMSLFAPWFEMTPKGQAGTSGNDNLATNAGYPELLPLVQSFTFKNVTGSLASNVSPKKLYNENGSLTPRGRLYCLIADIISALSVLVLFGIILGPFGRIGHFIGLVGLLIFTGEAYRFASYSHMTMTPQPGYFIALIGFILGIIMGGSSKKSKKGKSRGSRG